MTYDFIHTYYVCLYGTEPVLIGYIYILSYLLYLSDISLHLMHVKLESKTKEIKRKKTIF